MIKIGKSKIIIALLLASFITIAVLFFSVTKKSHSDTNPGITVEGDTFGSYETAKSIVREVMKSYYYRQDALQYNYAKTKYGVEAPEAATSQNTLHSVCAAYSYDVYSEAFGMHHDLGTFLFPRYNYEVTTQAGNYYRDENHVLDGHYLLYYEKKSESIKYVYSDSSDPNFDAALVSNFAQIIQPGDIFTFTGHVMMAYDKVCKEYADDGTCSLWDVLMLHSVGGPRVMSRIDGTPNLYYNVFSSSRGKNNIIDVDRQGTIQFFWLSSYANISKNGRLNCGKTECSAIRPYYNDNGEARFNYPIKIASYNRSLIRLQYPGIVIDKTSSSGTNNVVHLGDEITYTIEVTNHNDFNYEDISYDSFVITENISDLVDFQSADYNAHYSGNQVYWQISNLGTGESVSLHYTVKVKDDINNISQVVSATGRLTSDLNATEYLPIADVNNKIVPKVTEKNYSNCYNSKVAAGKKGLELINETYKCVHNENFQFDEFDFKEMFNKKKVTSKGTTEAIKLKPTEDERVQLYQKMILNNYWSGLTQFTSTNNDEDSESLQEDELVTSTYTLPRWNSADIRNKIIKEFDFQEGDVLIYSIDYSETPQSLIHTKEDGLYAYIYINGKFIGVNGSGNTVRNEFTYDYYEDNNLDYDTHLYSKTSSLTSDNRDKVLKYANYQTLYDKDYYVILRPELVIKEVYNIEIESMPSKITYLENTDSLDLTGGKVKITYNDNTEKIVGMSSSNVSVTGFNNSSAGEKTVTITLDGKKTSFKVSVIENTEPYATISVNKSQISVNEMFDVNVEIANASSWDINVSASGPVTDCTVNEQGHTDDGTNIARSFNVSCKPTGDGTIELVLSGNIASNTSGITKDLNDSVKVTVQKVKETSGDKSAPDTGVFISYPVIALLFGGCLIIKKYLKHKSVFR